LAPQVNYGFEVAFVGSPTLLCPAIRLVYTGWLRPLGRFLDSVHDFLDSALQLRIHALRHLCRIVDEKRHDAAPVSLRV